MKNTLLITLLALGGATQAFADKVVYVNGNKVDLDVESITFKGDNLSLVVPNANSQTQDLEEVEIDFATAEGVDNTDNTTLSFNNEVNDELKLTGTEAGTLLQIMTVDGKIIYTGTAAEGETIINTSSLSSAPYLLKVGNQTYKFIKK